MLRKAVLQSRSSFLEERRGKLRDLGDVTPLYLMVHYWQMATPVFDYWLDGKNTLLAHLQQLGHLTIKLQVDLVIILD